MSNLLREVITMCRKQFSFYVDSHMGKTPPDMDKAATNQEFVELCDSALKEPEWRDAETYCLALLDEEMHEAGQIIGKALRFGYHTPGRLETPYHGETAKALLEKELGDVWAAIHFASKHGVVDIHIVLDHATKKFNKLMDPNEVDNLGRRLAPPAPGFS